MKQFFVVILFYFSICFKSISFPEPTCLLVSAKTRSSGRNNQFPETKKLGLPVSWRMCALAENMTSRDKIDVDLFHKDIQYASKSILSPDAMF